MPIDKRMVGWLALGGGLGAVVRSIVAPAWTGIAGLVAVALMTILGALLAGVALGVGRGRMTALVLGLAGGAASSGFYAVVGITADLKMGVAFLVAVPLLTAVAFTAGVSAAGIMRHRTKVAR